MLAFEFGAKFCNVLMRASNRGRDEIGVELIVFLDTHIEKRRRSSGADKTGKLWYGYFGG